LLKTLKNSLHPIYSEQFLESLEVELAKVHEMKDVDNVTSTTFFLGDLYVQ